jgi:HD-like signal output (HDOD) protein
MIPTFEVVCQRALALPAAPILMPRIMQVLAKEDSSVCEFEAVVKLDTALAASTLRLANSAYFASGHSQVDNLEEAIQRLGQREIYRLAALALAGRWMNTPVDGGHWEASDFCRFSLVSAVAAEYLAEQSGRVEPQTAYTAGLVHEVGKLAVAYSCAPHFGAIRTHLRDTGCSWLAAERAVLGYNYAEIGAALLKKWNFPAALVAVARYNPPTPSVPADALPLVMHVHAAKFLAATMGPGAGEDGFLFELNAPLLAEWGFTPSVLEAALPVVFDRASRIMQEKLSYGTLLF